MLSCGQAANDFDHVYCMFLLAGLHGCVTREWKGDLNLKSEERRAAKIVKKHQSQIKTGKSSLNPTRKLVYAMLQ